MKHSKQFSFVLIVAMALAFQSCLFNKAPEACFSASTNEATVTFSSACAEDAEAWDWDFGDGSTSILQNPTHTYTTSGSFTVTLRVTSKKGKTNTTTQSVTATVDPCIGVTCVNGNCVGGSCNCNPGYHGADCSIADNANYSGLFNLTESCNPSGPDSYAITVSPQFGNPSGVSFLGLWRSGQFNAIANLQAGNPNSFTIPLQAITSATGYSLEGSGTISTDGTTINVTYSVSQTGTSNVVDICTGTMVK